MLGAVGIVLYYRNLHSENSFEKYLLGYVSAISIYIGHRWCIFKRVTPSVYSV